MRKPEKVLALRNLSQRYAYISIQMHECAGRQMGLSGTDHKYLGFLIQNARMTAGDLAMLTGLTTGAVTGLIDRFEKRGLLKRAADPEDRRKVLIIPDVSGITALLEPVYKDFQNDTEDLFASFTLAELQTLERYFLSAMAIMNAKIAGLTGSANTDENS